MKDLRKQKCPCGPLFFFLLVFFSFHSFGQRRCGFLPFRYFCRLRLLRLCLSISCKRNGLRGGGAGRCPCSPTRLRCLGLYQTDRTIRTPLDRRTGRSFCAIRRCSCGWGPARSQRRVRMRRSREPCGGRTLLSYREPLRGCGKQGETSDRKRHGGSHHRILKRRRPTVITADTSTSHFFRFRHLSLHLFG